MTKDYRIGCGMFGLVMLIVGAALGAAIGVTIGVATLVAGLFS